MSPLVGCSAVGSVVSGPLTPALSLGERELKADRGVTAIGDRLPLPQGEGWGEGTIHRKFPPTYLTSILIPKIRRQPPLTHRQLLAFALGIALHLVLVHLADREILRLRMGEVPAALLALNVLGGSGGALEHLPEGGGGNG